MIKRITSLAILLVVVCSMVFAQAKPGGVARELALGGSNPGANLVVNPFVFDDPVMTLINPAFVGNYRDYVWMNVAGGAINNFNAAADDGYGRQNAGVNFGLGKELTVGAVLSYDPSGVGLLRPGLNNFINAVGARAPNPAGIGAPGAVEVFELVGGYKLSGLSLGFAVMYGWTNSDFKSGTTTNGQVSEAILSGSVLGLRAGALVDLSGGNYFEGSAAFRMDKVKDKLTVAGTGNGTGQSNYSVGATEIVLNARGKLKLSNRFSFVPYAAFATASGEPKEDDILAGATATTLSVKNTTTGISIGVGGELRTSTFYMAGGVAFASAKTKTETTPGGAVPGTTTATTSTTAFPVFNLGTEWWFTDWFAGRMGYYRAFGSAGTKNEPPAPGVTTETNVFAGNSFCNFAVGSFANDNLVTLGVALKFGGFALDATVSEEALRRGLGLLGAQDNMNTFGYVTLSYCFE